MRAEPPLDALASYLEPGHHAGTRRTNQGAEISLINRQAEIRGLYLVRRDRFSQLREGVQRDHDEGWIAAPHAHAEYLDERDRSARRRGGDPGTKQAKDEPDQEQAA
jgi:hypothetical protein